MSGYRVAKSWQFTEDFPSPVDYSGPAVQLTNYHEANNSIPATTPGHSPHRAMADSNSHKSLDGYHSINSRTFSDPGRSCSTTGRTLSTSTTVRTGSTSTSGRQGTGNSGNTASRAKGRRTSASQSLQCADGYSREEGGDAQLPLMCHSSDMEQKTRYNKHTREGWHCDYW